MVDMIQIWANPWNPNVMDVETSRALFESMEDFGDLDPILVRPLGAWEDLNANYEIVDGEHRWKEHRNHNVERIEVLVAELSDFQAKKYTVIANETRGRPDSTKLNVLLEHLSKEYGLADTQRGLPYSQEELEQMIALAIPVQMPEIPAIPDTSGKMPAGDDWETFTVKMPRDAFERFMDAYHLLEAEMVLPEENAISYGLVIDALSMEYCGSN